MTVMAKHMRRAAVPEGSAERNRACQRFWVVTAALAAVVALVCELGLFNLLHWTSLGNTPVSLDVQPSVGLTVQGSTYTITDPDNAYLELTGIDAHVSTLFIGLSACDDMALDITVFMTDEANSTYTALPSEELTLVVPASRYLELHTAGASQSLRIGINEAAGYTFSVGEGFVANATAPFDFSPLRLCVVFVLACFVLAFRPSSPLFRTSLSWRSKAQKALIVVLAVVEVGAFGAFSYRGFSTNDTWEAHDQYDDLANAFLSGNVVIDKEVPEAIRELDNPYDPGARAVALQEAGQSELSGRITDFAYYNGQFYSYFGPVPALMLFAPFKLITGHDMPTWLAVFFYGALFIVAIKVLLVLLCDRLLKLRPSLGLFLLADFLLCGTTGLIYLGYLPVVYSVPIISSLAFAAWGLACWLAAKRGAGEVSAPLLVVGAVCIALTLGCRQSFVLCALLAFPLFWEEITRYRAFFSRRGIGNTACVMAPFVLAGVAVMAYNAARFGSPLDFGATYNLTSNDMTKRGFELARFPLGIFSYLFQPLSLTGKFPFMTTVPVTSNYQGYTSSEPMFGGFYAFCTIALVSFAFCSRRFKAPGSVRGFALLLMGIGFTLMLFDIQASGITARYMADFSFFLLLPAVLALFMFEQRAGTGSAAWAFHLAVVVASLLCLGLNAWSIFIDGRYGPLNEAFPSIYYGVKQALSFLW